MRYEIRKLFLNKIIIFVLAGSVIFNLYTAYRSYLAIGSKESRSEIIDDKYKGEYTAEKYKLISEQMNTITEEDEEFWGYLDVYSQAQRYSEVIQYRQNVLNNASKLKHHSDSYIAATNARIEELFAEMPRLQITDITKINDVTSIFSGLIFVDIINIMLVIFAACSIFIIEHTMNTHKLVFSSQAGRLNTYIKKVICVIAFSFLLSVVTSICSCILTCTYGSAGDWLLYIQNTAEYMYAAYNLRLWQLVLCITLFRGIGYAVIGVCSMVVSLFFKRSIFPIIINSLIMVGGFLIYGFYSNYSPDSITIIQSKYKVYSIFKRYTFWGLLNDNGTYLQQYNPVNCFGFPIDTFVINILINVFFAIGIVSIGYLIYRKKDV